jgi:LacI family transcriptional regulator
MAHFFLVFAQRAAVGKLGAVKPKRILLAFQHYHVAYHQGAARYAREAGWILDSLFAQAHDGLPALRSYDGIIVHALRRDALRRYVERSSVPTVDLTGTLRRTGVPKVMHDYRALAATAADFFIHQGWKHIAFYISQPLATYGPDREPVYWPEFQNMALAHRRTAHLLEWTGKSNRLHWLRQQLAKLPKPLAVWAWDDFSAVEVLDAALQGGWRVPEQVAVLGTHNESLVCEFAPVPLSSLDSRREKQAYSACRILDQLMQGKQHIPAKSVIEAGDVVERLSTGHPHATHTAGLNRALRLIHTQFAHPLYASDVAREAGMSVRSLQLQLRRETGKSLSETLTHYRIMRARKRLLETADSVERIAEACGYGSLSAFSQAFKREVGVSPLRFRQKQ